MRFQQESVASVWSEALPLFKAHYEDIAHYQDIPLVPDFEQYLKLDELGFIKVFTARDDSTNELIGYACYFVRPNLHYKTSLQASQDVIYIKRGRRGLGYRFIHWCDEQLKLLGVQVVYHHVKLKHNFGPMLERQGYELIDLIYGKRLDREI